MTSHPAPDRRGRSGSLHLAVGECRVGQDQGADRPGGAAAADGHDAAAHPVPDLYQGRRVGNAEPPVRRLGEWAMLQDPDLRASCAISATTGRAGPSAQRGAAALCQGDRDARRAQDPDHPFLLQRDPAPLSAGGGRDPRFHRDGGPRAATLARRGARGDRRGPAPGRSMPSRGTTGDDAGRADRGDRQAQGGVRPAAGRPAATSGPPGLPEADYRRGRCFQRFDGAANATCCAICRGAAEERPNDRKGRREARADRSPGFADLPVLESVFLTGPGAERAVYGQDRLFPDQACRERNHRPRSDGPAGSRR